MRSSRAQNKNSASLDMVTLEESQLRMVADFIGKEVGIQLPMSKHKLVEGRLRRRLSALGFSDFKSYLKHVLESPEGELEKVQLIDVITTNKTNFYRESAHFDYLETNAVEELVKIAKAEERNDLHFWSAGCSSGEEPYTLGLVLNEIAFHRRDFTFDILATDISQKCLHTANRGVYTERQIDVVPLALRKKYFLRSRNASESLVQMGRQLRDRINFKTLNLMNNEFNMPQQKDAIFCRNVMIYFNNELREALVARFEKQLVTGGYLFVGHSESLNGIKTTLKQVSPMVYRKQ